MFCVIQEVERKKPDRPGYKRELISEWLQSSIFGEDISHYFHYDSDERFERSVKKAFRISIHENCREGGRIKKRQFSICTAGYYDLAEDMFSLCDWGDRQIEKAAEALGADAGELYELIEKKLEPLKERIQAEFAQTEEYKAHQKHEKIITIYAAKKVKFNEQYGLEPGSYEYDRCYDVFGNLGHPENLEKIKAEYRARKEYERQSRERSRGYYEKFFNNYKNRSGGCAGLAGSSHDGDDRNILKQFYRELSKKYHPDANPDTDTSEQMKVLNRLRQEWGI